MERLNKTLRGSLRIITGGLRSTPIPLLHAWTRIPPLNLIIERSSGRLLLKAQQVSTIINQEYNNWTGIGDGFSPYGTLWRWQRRISPSPETLKQKLKELETIHRQDFKQYLDRSIQPSGDQRNLNRYHFKILESKKKGLNKLGRREGIMLFRALTGHGLLKTYLHRFSIYIENLYEETNPDDDNCRYCMEAAETFQHVIFECLALPNMHRIIHIRDTAASYEEFMLSPSREIIKAKTKLLTTLVRAAFCGELTFAMSTVYENFFSRASRKKKFSPSPSRLFL